MKVEVVTPEEFMGDVIGDLNSRRGQVGSTEPRGNATAINGCSSCEYLTHKQLEIIYTRKSAIYNAI